MGALRDALFKELFARHNGGQNILRIEDTDRTRYDSASEQEFIDTLRWAGIEFDEGPHIGGPHAPYRQSERKEAGIYAHWIEQLLAAGHAYKAFETPKELEEMREFQQINKQPVGYFGGDWRDASEARVEAAIAEGKPFVVRLKVRRNRTIVIEDQIRGRIEWDSNTVDDPVLIKADGMPTYHFAAMVDDHLMGITHIMRGEEWISSAPKHAELFDLFGWERPVFVHCPVIVGADGKKLSKRHGATRVLDYASMGYLPGALRNFIALIGWSPGDDREILSDAELIEAFSLNGLQPSPGRFDLEKLKWLNGHAIRSLTPDDLLDAILSFVGESFTERYWTSAPAEDDPDTTEQRQAIWSSLKLLAETAVKDRSYVVKAVELEQPRVQTLAEFGEACAFFFKDLPVMDPKAVTKWLTVDHATEMFDFVATQAASCKTVDDYRALLESFQQKKGFEKLGPVVHPIRVALTGRTFGPGLFELMELLGPTRIGQRLERAKGLGAST